MAPHVKENMHPHPEDLSRRISEIDLTKYRRRTDTESGNPSRYSEANLLKLPLSEQEGACIPAVAVPEGIETRNDFPVPPPPTPDAYQSTPGNDDVADDTSHAVQAPVAAQKKKNKKKRSSGKRKNKNAAPTGFEEFYADPPITPDEHDEERDIYATNRPFHGRIETCIQRYRKRRNLDSVRANILTKYLMAGGVDSSTTKAFTGGLDQETLESSTADEIAAIQATDYILTGSKNAKYYDPAEPDHWVVDFEGVAKGFLSHTVPRRFSLHQEAEVKQLCAVIRNFLNYVLAHGVCPEFTKDVLAARKVCDLAEKELWSIKQLHSLMPGDFNVAASILYGGHYMGSHCNGQAWAADYPTTDDFVTVNPGFGDTNAEIVFKAAIAFTGSEDLFLKFMKTGVAIVKTETKCYEVTTIERASIQKIHEYKNVQGPQGQPIEPLGFVQFKSWNGPSLDEEDLTDDDEDDSSQTIGVETFWVEDTVLQHFFVGMKLELVVHELNIGIKFFDRVLGLYCSFYSTLLNEKVIECWKEPSLNSRPPPTEDNPDAEENVLMLDEEMELKDYEKDFGEKIEVRVPEPKSEEGREV